MSKIITSDNGIELEVCSLGIAVVNHEEETETWARLTDVQRVELAAALDPGRRGLHVRLDNQAATLATYRRELDEADARAEQACSERNEAERREGAMERERDAAVARAEQAGRELARVNDELDRARAEAVEAKARAEADRRYSGDPNHAFIEGALWATRHALGQEDRHVAR